MASLKDLLLLNKTALFIDNLVDLMRKNKKYKADITAHVTNPILTSITLSKPGGGTIVVTATDDDELLITPQS